MGVTNRQAIVDVDGVFQGRETVHGKCNCKKPHTIVRFKDDGSVCEPQTALALIREDREASEMFDKLMAKMPEGAKAEAERQGVTPEEFTAMRLMSGPTITVMVVSVSRSGDESDSESN